MNCKICNTPFGTYRALGVHLKKAHKNCCGQAYYDKYLKKPNEGVCPVCGEECKFISLSLGYHKYCSVKCQSNATKDAAKKTKFRHFGEGNFFSKEGIASIKKKNSENFKERNAKAIESIKKRLNVTDDSIVNISQFQEVKDLVAKTNLERFGNKCSLHGSNQEKTELAIFDKYGYKNPSQNPDVFRNRRKRFLYKHVYFDSSWELAYFIWLEEHDTVFEYQPKCDIKYVFEGDEKTYHPDFKVNGQYVEIKGPQFFENGKMINPYDRSQDAGYEAKHQCMLANNVKILMNCDEYVSYVEKKYTKDFLNLFAVNLPFPYLNEDLRLKGDMDVIRHFHKSIYEASYNNRPSPLVAWQDKDLILKVALNRLKYVHQCRPADILQGFNVMKVAPKVSIFKSSLAERLVKTYLNDYETVFDPFSGFSGRMVGAANANKTYIGQDIHKGHVDESNALIAYKGYTKCKVIQKDIFEDEGGEYDCIFTCPPYGGKEHWNKNNDEVEKTCDEWIDICLSKYKCKRYLFVVDDTVKYKDKIIETLENKSHFGSNYEYIVMI